jgi:site-specific DNA recombinase
MRKLRCAIYTRKSTEEGLDMDFNSLDAQREACEAYVTSQRSEGWTMIPAAYDDGGVSGGTMERPALQRLLADVRAGKIDVIVVYKVDRLTRALADFAKIVDILDTAGASFVSVTQAFNTTTSMGRLTLNVLLSFAQFEREVIAERVRDKIAQSKARGIWMGGPVPLGYDVNDRKLIPNAAEAATVVHIFQTYLEQPSVRALKMRLDEQGVRTKVQQTKSGPRGGCAFSRGALYWLLSNPIFIGKLRHKNKIHDGQHEAIIRMDLWEAVQAKLAASAAERGNAMTGNGSALLQGLIHDGSGRPMSPSFTVKAGRRYPYYVSSISKDIDRETHASRVAPVTRIAARTIEGAAREAVRALLTDEARIADLDIAADATLTLHRIATAAELARQLGPNASLGARNLFERLKLSIVIHADRVVADLSRPALRATLDHRAGNDLDDEERIGLTIAADIHRGKRGAKLVIAAAKTDIRAPDPRLVALIAKAHRAREHLFANAASRGDRHAERLARLAYLAPDITSAILDGAQPRALTSRRLLKLPALPLGWPDQRTLLGFS